MPRHHLGGFTDGRCWRTLLILVAGDHRPATMGDFAWHENDNYDMGYQGLVEVLALPGEPSVLVSFQRSSTIMIHDPRTSHAVDRIDLADRGGNPGLAIVGSELWTTDYDTFVRVHLPTRGILASTRIQPCGSVEAGGKRFECQQYAGDLLVWTDGNAAVIPRPYSGDVVVLDPINGRVPSAVPTGRQTIECVVTSSGRLLARDWHLGDWMLGPIKV